MPERNTRSLTFKLGLGFLFTGLATMVVFGLVLYLFFQLVDRVTPGSRWAARIAIEELLEKEDWYKPEILSDFSSRYPEVRFRVKQSDEILFNSHPQGKNWQHFSPHECLREGLEDDSDTFRRNRRHGRPTYEHLEREGRSLTFFAPELERRISKPGRMFILPLAFVTVLTFVFLFLYVRRVLHPLEEIVRVTRAMSHGDLEVRLPSGSTQEFDLLYRSFNSMAERLQASFANQQLMLSHISHDLKHYLNRMKLTVEVDVDNEEVSQSLNEDIGEMLNYVERAREALRAGSGRDLYQKEVVDLPALICALTSESGFPCQCEPGLNAMVDPTWFTQLMRNLLENVNNHGEDGEVRLEPRNERFLLSVENKPLHTMDHESLPLLLQPFHRGDQARSGVAGSGLGLYIARAVAEGHGFDLTLSITENGRFRVEVEGPLL